MNAKRTRDLPFILANEARRSVELSKFLIVHKPTDPTNYPWESIECKNPSNYLSTIDGYQLIAMRLFAQDHVLPGDPEDPMEVWQDELFIGLMQRKYVLERLACHSENLDELASATFRKTDKQIIIVGYVAKRYIHKSYTMLFYNETEWHAAMIKYRNYNDYHTAYADLVRETRGYILNLSACVGNRSTFNFESMRVHKIEDYLRQRRRSRLMSGPYDEPPPIIPDVKDTGFPWENIKCANDNSPFAHLEYLQHRVMQRYLETLHIPGNPNDIMEVWYMGRVYVMKRGAIPAYILLNANTKTLNAVNRWRFRVMPENALYIISTCTKQVIIYYEAQANELHSRFYSNCCHMTKIEC